MKHSLDVVEFIQQIYAHMDVLLYGRTRRKNNYTISRKKNIQLRQINGCVSVLYKKKRYFVATWTLQRKLDFVIGTRFDLLKCHISSNSKIYSSSHNK